MTKDSGRGRRGRVAETVKKDANKYPEITVFMDIASSFMCINKCFRNWKKFHQDEVLNLKIYSA